jgi:hypothetical protein
MDYTISLTEAQNKALEYVAINPYDWIVNSAENRARIAADEIVNIYVQHKLKNNEQITQTNKDDIVLAAFEEGIVKTAAEKHQEIIENNQNSINS